MTMSLKTLQTDPERRGLQRYIPEIATEQQTRPEKRRRQGPNVVSEDDEVDEGIEITEIGSEESGDESEVEATQRQRAQIQQRVRDRRSGDSVSSPARFSSNKKPNECDVIKSIELFNFMVSYP